MTVINSTLRPGLLVSFKSNLTGNISYQKRVIEPEHVTETGVEQARWETVRTIVDRAEHDLGRKMQMDARMSVVKVCAYTAFGLLCPEADAEKLKEAVKEAREIADRFNAQAQISRMSVYVIVGRVAPDDVEAVRAVNSEIRGLIKTMEDGIANLDVKAIRDAANSARQMGAMLTPEAAEKVKEAITEARKVARKIVKAGEQAAQEVDRTVVAKLEQCRTAFLDLEDGDTVAAPEAEARAVDLMPDDGSYTDDRRLEDRQEMTMQPDSDVSMVSLDGQSNESLEPLVQAVRRARGRV